MMDVLIAEDEEALANSVRRVFERRGHHVETAATGQDTLKALEKRPFSLLLLDWGLPDVDGLVLIARLRQAGRTVPVLMLTGRDKTDDMVRALDAGADDFVAKSDTPLDVVVARAEALHRRACYPAAPRRVDAGGIVVDEGAKTVHVNGEPVELAPSELRILTILAASLGRIVSRAELVSGCWGELASVSDNALESVVKRLRKKLGTEAGRLQSVRLRGYVLVEPPP
jgi:two-component system OmpR family response regulator